jgi:dTDP-L-rhamnose 4-epimerase
VRTLVTGGAGFIGRHLVDALLERGDDVVVLDSLESQVHGPDPPPLPDGVMLIHADVGSGEAASRALEGVERVVHLAAAVGVGQSMYEIERYVGRNTYATAAFLERMVESRRRPARLVVASSMSIYGEGEYECADHGRVAPAPRPEERLRGRAWECVCPRCGSELAAVGTSESKPLIPTSVYAVTKRDHEELCLVVGAAYGIPAVALRFFNVYGPGQALSNPYTGVAAIFASRLLNGRPPLVFEDGRQSRDFIHVSDVVHGILLALESDGAVGRAINLGTGRAVTVAEVAQALSEGLRVTIEAEYPGTYRVGDIRHCFADPALAGEVLGFRAGVVVEEGMRELAAWLAGQEAADHVERASHELATRGLAR